MFDRNRGISVSPFAVRSRGLPHRDGVARRRSARGVVGLILAGLLLAACGGETTGTTVDDTTVTTATATTVPSEGEESTTTVAPGDGESVVLTMTADYSDLQLETMLELIDKFESENPGIEIDFDPTSYDQILESLPLQLEIGEGPDIMKLTRQALSQYFLDLSPYVDTEYWEENMAQTNQLLSQSREVAPRGIYTDVTVTGPWINRTLFEQAGIEVPSDTSDEVTWEEWAEVTRQVADATGTPYAMAFDKRGQRVAGPAISMGATFFDDEGNVALVGDEGFRRMMELLVEWHEDGTMPPDVFIGEADPEDEFTNANVVLYMSGNWKVSGLQETIGDAFEWGAVPPPCGPAACTGQPGGGFVVGNAGTEHPAEVAAFLDFLAQEENYRHWAETNALVPGHKGLVEAGLDYSGTLTPEAEEALNVFAKSASSLHPKALEVQNHPAAPAIFDTSMDRLTQVLVGELTLDEAIERMQQDVETVMAENG